MRASVAGLAVAVVAALVLPGAAWGRVVTAETVLPTGESGFLPLSGSNPALGNQIGLFESFAFKPAGFDLPGATESPRAGVTITRDSYGVPNVRAGNDRDLWFGAGYAVAQDRMVQLELFRRGTKGTLAQVLGKSRLADDILARRDYYTDKELRRMLARLPRSLRRRFDAYAAGINAWAARVKADSSLKPRELALLKLDFAPWRAIDSARIGVQLARTIPSSDGAELDNWRLLRAVGPKRFDRLLPLRRRGQVSTVPAANGRFPSNPGRTRADERAGFKASRRYLKGIKAPTPAASTTAARSGVGAGLPLHGGSDAWAVRGPGRTAYLFNGPQLGFALPEQLHELEVHRPGLDARGVTPPGVPIVGIGRNAHIAWGFTSGLSDDDDLYAEKLVGKERYRFRGKTRRMRCRTVTIPIAGAKADRERLCRTVHGPVQARAGTRVAFARRYAIWGHEIDTLRGLAQLDEASSVKQAAKAIAKVSWNENALVADDKGNIGWWHPGRLPVRPKRWDERLPFPGTGQAEWRGMLKHRQLPHVINPKQGWLANWNNMPSVGWTNGDTEATERNNGRLHRAAYLFRLVARAAAAPSLDAVKAVDRGAGTVAQQRPLLDGRLRVAADGATGAGKTVLDTIVAWDGNYDRTAADGTVDPGVAAWVAIEDALAERKLPRAAIERLHLNASRSHQFDAPNAVGVALLGASAGDLRAAAEAAAAALTDRYGSADPAAWREQRRQYDVSITGLAPKPELTFYDRGTWEQVVQLGP
jgi:acyl-homoserine lactone acylase PvdQ